MLTIASQVMPGDSTPFQLTVDKLEAALQDAKDKVRFIVIVCLKIDILSFQGDQMPPGHLRGTKNEEKEREAEKRGERKEKKERRGRTGERKEKDKSRLILYHLRGLSWEL